ncbi:uncharacterized protein [Aegilops tauschii subsp. strangulata]|uniref:uncharacterized protein n=1 Tax=Aegilops tauschii subsp. strangulata TaxID=200361 RepID=UPI003CC85325
MSSVVSTAPLGEIIGCRDASGRVAKWALELAGHTILYEPRTMIKSQALADLLVDWTKTQYLPPLDSMHWCMHLDGLKMRLSLGADIVLSSVKGDRLKYALQIHFAASKNVAEYEALVHGFWLAKELEAIRILRGCKFLHLPRAENEGADTLAKIASSRQSVPSDVSLEHLHKPSVKPSPDSESVHVPYDPAAPRPSPQAAPTDPAAPQPGRRTAPIDPAAPQPGPGTAPTDPPRLNPARGLLQPARPHPNPAQGPLNLDRSRQVQRRASTYNIIKNELVKRSSTGVFQRCVEQDKGIEILLDIHQESLVLKCEGCQHFSQSSHQPASALRTIPITWPFAVWGLDMVGPFKTAQGGMTPLLVAVDKFTKWIEARPIEKLDGPTAVRFIKDIAVRYGMPNSIITDNGTNFAMGALA